jgi:hypothetical protein
MEIKGDTTALGDFNVLAKLSQSDEGASGHCPRTPLDWSAAVSRAVRDQPQHGSAASSIF